MRAPPSRCRPRSPERRAVAARLGGAVVFGALGVLGNLGLASGANAAGFDLGALTALLARSPAGEARFTESRTVRVLDQTLTSSGRLSYRAPDVFVRETLEPWPEKLAVDGNTLTLSRGGRTRTMQLDASPEATVIVEAIRGTLTGNRATLERIFETAVRGDATRWTLELTPRDARLRGQVASVRVTGSESTVREIQVLLPDGDRSVMTIVPVGPARR